MYSVSTKGKFFEKYLYLASTYLKQAHFEYPLDAYLIQVALYMNISLHMRFGIDRNVE